MRVVLARGREHEILAPEGMECEVLLLQWEGIVYGYAACSSFAGRLWVYDLFISGAPVTALTLLVRRMKRTCTERGLMDIVFDVRPGYPALLKWLDSGFARLESLTLSLPVR